MDKEKSTIPEDGIANSKNQTEESKPERPKKPPKIEDKPFEEFINEHLIPGISSSLSNQGVNLKNISFNYSIRPVIADKCWIVNGELEKERQFWLCFAADKITSSKTIILSESGAEPSLIESFLIDERKITLALLISRLIQRLNGQKWLGPN